LAILETVCLGECDRMPDQSVQETRPRRQRRRRVKVLIAVCLVAAGVIGWRLYNRWTVDRRLKSLADCSGGGIYAKEMRGPKWYVEWANRWKLPVPRRAVHFASSIATDADLKYVGQVRSLRGVTLVGCPVTDAGMIHLQGLTKLTELNLNGTRVTDRTLEYVRGMADLKELHLRGAAVTDWGRHVLRTRGSAF